MRIGIFVAHLGRQLGCYRPSRTPELPQHPGIVWARTYRVRWRR